MRRAIVLVGCLSLAACEDSYGPPPEYPPPPQQGGVAAQPAAPAEAQASGDVDLDAPAARDAYADTDSSALSDFHPALDAHGTWVDDATYGTVWVPSPAEVGPDFAPYVTSGHWEYGDDYVWVSDYDWGWAPFHYGRWVYVAGRGWSWIPGREYAGAWVTWRTGDEGYEYVGWAPMPPLWVWQGGVVVWLAAPPPAPYIFCETRHVFAPVVATHIVVGERVAVIGGRTRPFVAAAPAVAGRVALMGPPPARIGIGASAVVHASAHPSVVRAQQFARPSTAVGLGARAPSRQPVRRAPAAPSYHSAPSYHHSAPSFHSAPHGGGGHHR